MNSSSPEPSRRPRADVSPPIIGVPPPRLLPGAIPAVESRRREYAIRAFALFALAGSTAYLVWRALFTIDPAALIVALPMLLLEIHHAFGLALYTFSLWDMEHPAWHPVESTDLRVAILIPTYDESPAVLLPVIAAAVSIDPPHATWVLDDGNRPEIAELARGLGADYLAREVNTDAKAGNLNNALDHIEADLVAAIDADHVVAPDFLRHTLGYFDDPGVAVVQTPQDFYNVDSFEHQADREGHVIFSEQAVFYRVILPAKNHWNAAFWCGTGAVLRVAALRDVGGVAVGTVTEDIHTSIRLHKAGWRIVAHNEVLARGLAAAGPEQYALQRRRWARGAMQVMKTERLITSSDLTLAQRAAYAATLWGWFDSIRTLMFIALPILVLATGLLPIKAPLVVFGPLFLATFFAQFTALRLLARGHYPPILSVIFEMLRMPAVIPALGEFFWRKEHRFRVTPKGKTSDDRLRHHTPPLIATLAVLSMMSLEWFGLVMTGIAPVSYENRGAMVGTAVFLVANVVLLLAAARRITGRRYAGERRGSVRFDVDMTGTVRGAVAMIRDISLSGARVRVVGMRTRDPMRGETVRLHVDEAEVDIEAVVIHTKTGDGGDVGLRFADGQIEALRSLSLVLFHGHVEDAVVEYALAA